MQILLVYFVFFLSYVIFLRAYRDSEHNNVHTYAADFKTYRRTFVQNEVPLLYKQTFYISLCHEDLSNVQYTPKI